MNKLTYSIEEVSELLGISKSKVYNLCRNNKIPNIRLDGRIVVPVGRFDSWLNDSIKGGN